MMNGWTEEKTDTRTKGGRDIAPKVKKKSVKRGGKNEKIGEIERKV